MHLTSRNRRITSTFNHCIKVSLDIDIEVEFVGNQQTRSRSIFLSERTVLIRNVPICIPGKVAMNTRKSSLQMSERFLRLLIRAFDLKTVFQFTKFECREKAVIAEFSFDSTNNRFNFLRQRLDRVKPNHCDRVTQLLQIIIKDNISLDEVDGPVPQIFPGNANIAFKDNCYFKRIKFKKRSFDTLTSK